MVIGSVAFLYRELTRDKPLVRLNVFKNRNFAVGCLLIFLFGGVIYGLVYSCLSSSSSGWATRPWPLDSPSVLTAWDPYFSCQSLAS